MTTVYQTFSVADADLIRSMLDAAGLHPDLAHDTAALSVDGYAMAVGGIAIRVPDDEALAARELISTKDSTSE